MKSGEAWAYQIYFKELASMPKEWLNEVDTSNVFKDIKNMKEFQHSKITLFQSLINNNSMSKDEILELIKLFNNTKINDYILKDKKVTNIFEDYDDMMKEIGL
jgi:ribosomal protein L1